jgi:hypothetical protein
VLPSDPVIKTFVAFADATDNVEDPPTAIVVGLAEIVTVGAPSVLLLWVTPPQPAARSAEVKAQNLKESTVRRFINRGTTGKCVLPSIAHVNGFSRQLGRISPTHFLRFVGESSLTKKNQVK